MLGAVMLVHASYVAFVVTAPLLVLHAALARAPWARPLCWLHGLTILFVALQYAFDWPCPLTLLENGLAGRPADTEWLSALSGHGGVVVSIAAIYLLVSLVAHGAVWRRVRPA